jgi:hypothetical protein
MRLWKPPHTSLNHDADVNFCLFASCLDACLDAVGVRLPLGVHWRKLLKLILEKWDDGVDWIHVAQNRDQWRSLVNTLMIFRVPWNFVNFFSGWSTADFSKRTQLRRIEEFVFKWILGVLSIISYCNLFYGILSFNTPVRVTERSKTFTVFARSEAGIVGSNPTHGMDVWYVYVRFSVFLYR